VNAIIIRMCARFVKECNWRGFENPGGFGLEAWLHDHGAVDLKGCPRGRAQVSLVSAAVLVFCLLSRSYRLYSQEPAPDHQTPSAISGTAVSVPGQIQPDPHKYRIAPGDDLEVYVVGIPELSRDYRVSTVGTVAMPMVSGEIDAQNLTLEQLSKAISAELRKEGIVSEPHVFVTLKESPFNSVVVSGAVRKPAVYQIFGQTSLLSVLSLAEGLADDAGRIAVITRGERTVQDLSELEAGGKQSPGQSHRVVSVNIDKLWKSGDPALNLQIYPGDRINVSRAGVVYVVGAVNRAGGYVLTGDEERLTVLKALALAGDVTRTAKIKNAVILRKDPLAAGGQRRIPINLKKILANQAPDLQVSASDILFVPDSTERRALSPALAAAAAAAVIYHLP